MCWNSCKVGWIGFTYEEGANSAPGDYRRRCFSRFRNQSLFLLLKPTLFISARRHLGGKLSQFLQELSIKP